MNSSARRALTRIAVAVTAIAVAVPLTGCSIVRDVLGAPAPQPERDETTQEIVEEGDADIFAIRVGDCLNEATAETVSEVPVVPCDTAHDEEVFYDFTLTGTEYPGDDAVQTQADEGCYAQFGEFVGLAYEESTLEFYAYRPTEEGWTQLDDRVVSCMIYDPAGQTTGTLEGAAR
ncbi:septum formation family protein [Agromyces lapidis]|uniref:Septum formation family protein n=1 Tax=Agromyces lapidis TaxID=279574 RepID=A0ABV5SQW9_9MICO|nr:septum formation family protein [Agromyces lapidis]